MSPSADDIGITFVHVGLQRPFLDIAAYERLFSLTTQHLLQIAFDNGAYVAGGFGTIVARALLLSPVVNNDVLEALAKDVKQHLGTPRRPTTVTKSMHAWQRNPDVGDIDVWFPDAAAFQAFMGDKRRLLLLESGAVFAEETVTGTAVEHIVDGDAKVQVISRFLMPVEEQLSRFDIYNGMVALTQHELVVPEHWRSLEKTRTLHVSTWKCPWTINRFFKWMRKKGYAHVTPSTAEAIVSEGLAALDWFKRHEGDKDDSTVRAEFEKSIILKKMAAYPNDRQWFLKRIIDALPAERLLEVSAFFKPAKYDIAMQELTRRMPVHQLQSTRQGVSQDA